MRVSGGDSAIYILSSVSARGEAGGFVRGFGQFFTTRAALGIGEAPQFPANVRVVCDWFGKGERGFATGVWNSASTLGTAISAPLLTF